VCVSASDRMMTDGGSGQCLRMYVQVLGCEMSEEASGWSMAFKVARDQPIS
jgi:hypothetical protein